MIHPTRSAFALVAARQVSGFSAGLGLRTARQVSGFSAARQVSGFSAGLGLRTASATARRSFITSTTALSASYLLKYDYIPDVLEKRGPHREGHLDLAKGFIAEGRCLSGGPTGPKDMEVPTGALFIFTDFEAAMAMVANDPYVTHGIVTGHSIEEWNVVVSKDD